MEKKKGQKRKADINHIFEKLGSAAIKSESKNRHVASSPRVTESELIEGRIQASGKGFAFLIQEGVEQDLFLPPRNLHGAMHGDTVKVRQIQDGTATRGGVAEVVEVLRHSITTFVGKLKQEGAYYYVLPDDHRVCDKADVLSGDLNGAVVNDKVVVNIRDYGRGIPTVAVTEVLGDADAVGVDVLSVIRQFELIEEFKQDALDEAHATQTSVSADEVKGREDFRNDLVITIDGEDAKDLDDAISVTKTDLGYRLHVHIADVSHYVRAGSAIDKEAYHRGTSVYFPDRVLPMLPQELSNGICSLNEGVDRLTTSCIIDFDGEGKRRDVRVVKGVICSTHRMTYTKVQAILDGDPIACAEYADLIELTENMRALMGMLLTKRNKRGAVDFSVEEPHIMIDKRTGKITDIVAEPRQLSNRIIEEFMLAANEAIAYKFERLGVPFVYRVHETPSEEKIEALQAFIAGFGLKLNAPDGKVTPMDMQEFLNSAKDKPCEKVVSKVSLRAMQKAKYVDVCSGHFGLAATYYCHFTSPIRRYPDLTIHRIIGEFLTGGVGATEKFGEFVAMASTQSSEREVVAQQAEREVDDLKKAEYMHDHLGEEFDGTISGVTSWGLFVELSNTVEGLIRMENLPDDRYECNDAKYIMRGNNHTYQLGDPIKIRVISASAESRQVDFCIAGLPIKSERLPTAETKRTAMPGAEGKVDRFKNALDGAKKSGGGYGRGGASSRNGGGGRTHGGSGNRGKSHK